MSLPSTKPPSPSQGSAECGSPLHSQARPLTRRIRDHLQSDIDAKAANYVSVYACFLTGMTGCLSFSACYVWCGFQTGNVAQLGLAVARTFNPSPFRTYGMQKADQQALASLLCFLLGTTLGRVGDRIGAKTRMWLLLATFMQCLMAGAAALAAHYSGESGVALDRHDPSWSSALGMTALGFISASLGLQGIIGKRVGTPLNTTIVLTTTWVEIFNDPLLLSLKPVTGRDVRIAGVLSVFVGAFVGRALLGTRCGSAGTLGVLAGFRLLQMVWWATLRGPVAKVT